MSGTELREKPVKRRVDYSATAIGKRARVVIPYKWLKALGEPQEVIIVFYGDRIEIKPA